MRISNFDLNKKVFIIAELSANHNGSKDLAIKTIRAAKRAGADCIKLQTYTPESITLKSNRKVFLINDKSSIWRGQYLFDLYSSAYTPWEWHEDLFNVAKEEGLICFSSPFDIKAVDFLAKLDVPAYKIASFEITDIPLIDYISSKNKPILISTGIAKKSDIKLALKTCYKNNNYDIALLKCTSSYPTSVKDANIKMIDDLKKITKIVGVSDHTLGIEIPIVAVSLGAKIIEKHFIIDKTVGGPDASFSLDEKEFTQMVKSIRITEKALGDTKYYLTHSQEKSRKYSRSLYVVKDIKAGEKMTKLNVKSIRPGYGLHPNFYNDILGKVALKDIKKGTRMSLNLISK